MMQSGGMSSGLSPQQNVANVMHRAQMTSMPNLNFGAHSNHGQGDANFMDQ
jgi:hypothetical protein